VQLLISDANILIDLEEGELIKELFQLPFLFSIPDILFEEEMSEEHGYLPGLGLQLEELSGEVMSSAWTLTQKYTNPSRHDCFALALAKDKECPLLTGDKALRKAAEVEAVMVNGTLWIIEQMIHQKLITPNQARQAYQRMKDSARRLPWSLAESNLQEIEKELKQPE